MTDVSDRLELLFREIVAEAATNREFARRVERALAGLSHGGRTRSVEGLPGSGSRVKRPHRRARAVIDPFAAYEAGENVLRERLRELDIERLKDIVAEHGMDSAKLAMKWKKPDRLIELIVDTVEARSRKGDAFRVHREGDQVR